MAPKSRDMFVCELCGYIADRESILADIGRGVQLKLRSYKCAKCDDSIQSEHNIENESFLEQNTNSETVPDPGNVSGSLSQDEASPVTTDNSWILPESHIDDDEGGLTDGLIETNETVEKTQIERGKRQKDEVDINGSTYEEPTIDKKYAVAKEDEDGPNLDTKTKKCEAQIFACSVCEFKTKINQVLVEHVNGIHLKVKPHICEKCDFATAYHPTLSKHKKKTHHECGHCKFVSANAAVFKKHVRNHSKLREDDKKFNRKNGSNLDTKTKKREPGIFSCDICGYSNQFRHVLVDHVNGVHLKVKPYKCGRCEYTTAHKGTLFRHEKKPHHECGQCKFVSLSFVCFKEHLRKHNTQPEDVKVSNPQTDKKGDMSLEMDAESMEEIKATEEDDRLKPAGNFSQMTRESKKNHCHGDSFGVVLEASNVVVKSKKVKEGKWCLT